MYDQYKNDFDGITNAQAAFNQEFDAANALLAAGTINWEQYNNAVSVAQDALDSAGKSAEQNVSQIEELTNELARDIQDDLSNFLFDPFKDGLKGMIQQFGEQIGRTPCRERVCRYV